PGPFGANALHIRVNVGHHDLGIAMGGIDDALADIARATGHIEHAVGTAARTARVEVRHQRVLPEPVHAHAHQVVHQVIAVGDVVKNLVDQTLLVLKRDGLFTEVGGFSGLGHGLARCTLSWTRYGSSWAAPYIRRR